MPHSTSSLIFARPVLTKIINEPDYDSLKTLQSEINANAIGIPSIRGGGAHGHLALVLPSTTLLILTNNVAFEPPEHPGSEPDHTEKQNGNEYTETNRAFLADTLEYNKYLHVEQALKMQLLTAVDPIYIEILRDPILAFARVTCLKLLEHLTETYGAITFDQLEENMNNLDRLWDPAEPMETVWTTVRKCQLFAAEGKDPITDATVVRKTLNMLTNTGVFAEGIRDWRKLPPTEWTWKKFIQHFTLANKERQRLITTASAGYHGANAATTPRPPAPTSSPTSFYYCWSHGLSKHANHTSATCHNKAVGHIVDSTLNNMKGGCNNIQRNRDEPRVFVHVPRT
jgi:hypothetical protein